MGDERTRLVPGRGLLLLDDFCGRTGLSATAVTSLVLEGKLGGVRYEDGRVAELFDDTLPSADKLRDLGLVVNTD
jgi:hypothetical protein